MRDVFVRLEPRTRSADIEPGLAARVWDAAWLLGRQWVLGEFDGEDAGTPVAAEVMVASHRLEKVKFGEKTQHYDPLTAPLESLVEAAPLRPNGWTLRCKLEAGVLLAQALQGAGHQSLLTFLLTKGGYQLDDHTTPGQPAANALRQLALSRVPDGEIVYRAVREQIDWTSQARDVLVTWADEVDRRVAPPPDALSAWEPRRLEYRFAVQASGLAEPLQADEHHGIDLDWYSFDLGKAQGTGSSTAGQLTKHRAVPTPIRFAGMPEPRYWTFEKAQVDLGAVEASATDLARMAVLQFAFDYGNDAFMLPLQLGVGAVHKVLTLTVSDTFSGAFGGASVTLPPARRSSATSQRWSFLALEADDGTPSEYLFVPPVAAHAQRGVDLQDVRLMRDEMANLVWGIEHIVEGETGAPLDRAQALDRQRPQAFTAPTAGGLHYVLQTQVPANWFALELEPGVPRLLRLAIVSPSTASLLRNVQSHGLHEEEVPREGVRVREADLMARWIEGRTVTWRRVERMVGRGEGSSGMQFDLATTQR